MSRYNQVLNCFELRVLGRAGAPVNLACTLDDHVTTGWADKHGEGCTCSAPSFVGLNSSRRNFPLGNLMVEGIRCRQHFVAAI